MPLDAQNLPNPLIPQDGILSDVNLGDVREEHFRPAFDFAMDLARANIEAIKSNPDAPDFDNTVAALDRATQAVSYVYSLQRHFTRVMSSDSMEETQKTFQKELTDFNNDISMDPALFARIKSVYDQAQPLGLRAPDEDVLLKNTYSNFVRNGALLNDSDKQRVRDIDTRMAELQADFNRNMVDERKEWGILIEDENRLNGLPADTMHHAAQKAEERGHPGKYMLTRDVHIFFPALSKLEDRSLREELWRGVNRTNVDAPYDNRPLALEIARLRAERAKIFGYDSHADYVLERRMAEKLPNVTAMLDKVEVLARPAAEKELDTLRQYAAKTDGIDDLQNWDVPYYLNKYKAETFGFDPEHYKPYFPLEVALESRHKLAEDVFGLKLVDETELGSYHEDVPRYGIYDADSDARLSTLYSDLYARDGKRGGAWITEIESGGDYPGGLLNQVITLNANFAKPSDTQPTLLDFDNMATACHEMGHALHTSAARNRFPSLSAAHMMWDAVELVSQTMELFVYDREWLKQNSRHIETGEALPDEMIDNLLASQNFGEGLATMRQLHLNRTDLAWHGAEALDIEDPEALELEATENCRLLPAQGGLFSTRFSHIFSGSYSAGYYSYLWADILAADAYAAFKESPNLAATGRRFRQEIMECGAMEHPATMFRNFRGRDPDPRFMLERMGLVAENDSGMRNDRVGYKARQNPTKNHRITH